MAYEFHLEDVAPSVWKEIVASDDRLRPASHARATTPATGEVIEMDATGMVEALVNGRWTLTFREGGHGVSFRAPETLDGDPTWTLATDLARVLACRIVGDEGEVVFCAAQQQLEVGSDPPVERIASLCLEVEIRLPTHRILVFPRHDLLRAVPVRVPAHGSVHNATWNGRRRSRTPTPGVSCVHDCLRLGPIREVAADKKGHK